MRRSALLAVPALAMALASGPLVSSAVAAPPADYAGELQLLSFEFGEIRGTGSVNHFTMTSTSSLTGDVVAVVTNDLTCIGYEVPLQRSFTCHGTSYAEGNLSQELGGAAYTTTSRVRFRCSYVTGACSGTLITAEGTGAFAGARGVSMFEQDPLTGAGTFTFNVAGA